MIGVCVCVCALCHHPPCIVLLSLLLLLPALSYPLLFAQSLPYPLLTSPLLLFTPLHSTPHLSSPLISRPVRHGHELPRTRLMHRCLLWEVTGQHPILHQRESWWGGQQCHDWKVSDVLMMFGYNTHTQAQRVCTFIHVHPRHISSHLIISHHTPSHHITSHHTHSISSHSIPSHHSTVTAMALELLVWMKYMRSLACPGEAVGTVPVDTLYPASSLPYNLLFSFSS